MRKIILFLCLTRILAASLFTYTPEEIKNLKQLTSVCCMSNAELQRWDCLAQNSILLKKISFYENTRLFTYLYAAQAEAAALSLQVKGSYQGSLDPLSYQVIALFIPDIVKPAKKDAYSEALSQIVLKRIKERVEEENASTRAFVVPEEKQASFNAGLDVAKWKPWKAIPDTDYWPPPPPPLNDPVWKEQIKQIKQLQNPMTGEKKRIILRWAGKLRPWLDDWRALANDYIFSHCVDFHKACEVRAALMIGMYDCVTAYVNAKYHYLMIRPQTYDSSVTYIIPVPKHPSYPAGHACEGGVASTILSHFFPSYACCWKQMAGETGLSRIWAGIHYPLDIQEGEKLGNKVARKVLENQQ